MSQHSSRVDDASASPASSGGETLASLRSQIDAVDGSILGLVMARQSLSARAAAAKARGDRLKIRPGREAEVISRLQVLGQGFSPGLIERVWRELLSEGLSRQSPFGLALCASPEGEADLVDACRQRFGCGPTIRRHSEPAHALDQAAAGSDVAAVSLDGGWWAEAPTRWPDLSVFGVLSAPEPAGSPAPVALVLARVEDGALDGAGPFVTVRTSPPLTADTAILAQSPTHWLCLEPTPPDEAAVLGVACGWAGEHTR